MTSNQRLQRLAVQLITPLRLFVLLPAIAVGSRLLRSRQSESADRREAWAESRRLWMPANRQVDISVVMPAYNPGESLRPTVDRLVSVMRENGVGFELIVVSDGSTDGCMITLDGAGPEVRLVDLPANRGKGGALHAGFARARGAWVGFVDCDGDIDPAHLVDYLRAGQAADADIVYANKRHDASVSASSPFRKLVSMGFSTIVGTLFALGVNDTQTGCKLVRREVMADVLPRLRETRFAFDLELFVAAKSAGHLNAVAAPVELKERLAGSSVTKATILRTLTDALVVLGRRTTTSTYRLRRRPEQRVWARNNAGDLDLAA